MVNILSVDTFFRLTEILVWPLLYPCSTLMLNLSEFKLYELEPTDLVFYLREKNEDSSDADND